MPIDAICPAGHTLIVPDRMAGKTVRCPTCGQLTAILPIHLDNGGVGDMDRLDQSRPDKTTAPVRLRRTDSEADSPSIGNSSPVDGNKSPPRTPTSPKPRKASFQRRTVSPITMVSVIATLGVCGAALGFLGGFYLRSNPSTQAAAPPAATSTARIETFQAKPVPVAAPMNPDLVVQNLPLPISLPRPQITNSTQLQVNVQRPSAPIPFQQGIQRSPQQLQVVQAGDLEIEALRRAVDEFEKKTATDKSIDPIDRPDDQNLRPAEIVMLPSFAQEVVVGGSGRYLVASLPLIKKIAVLDVEQRKILHQIPIADQNVLIAASESKVLFNQRTIGTLIQCDLKTGRFEISTGTKIYRTMAVGSSSDGPLAGIGDTIELLSLNKFRHVPITSANAPLSAFGALQASAAGHVFGSRRLNAGAGDMAILEMKDSAHWSIQRRAETGGLLLPTADGRVILTESGRSTPSGRALTPNQPSDSRMQYFTAATGPYFFTALLYKDIEEQGDALRQLKLHCQASSDFVLPLPDVYLPRLRRVVPKALHPPIEHSCFFLPEVKSAVMMPQRNQFIIQHFDVDEELSRESNLYFFVSSTPPTRLPEDGMLSYQIEVKSKSGSVTFERIAGPSDLAVSENGLVIWSGPKDGLTTPVEAVVKITHSSNRSIAHEILLEANPPQLPPSNSNKRPSPQQRFKPGQPN